MQHEAQPAPGTEPPAGRLSRLSAGSRRINESLNVDVDAAPQAPMDGASSLARAPYAAIVTLDAAALGPAAPAGVDPDEGCLPAGTAHPSDAGPNQGWRGRRGRREPQVPLCRTWGF